MENSDVVRLALSGFGALIEEANKGNLVADQILDLILKIVHQQGAAAEEAGTKAYGATAPRLRSVGK